MHLLRIYFTRLMIAGVGMATISAQERYFDERYIYSQHFINPVLVNPGATGINDYQELILNYRNTWASFDGAPKTITLNFNGPVGNRLGFGAQLFRDTYGALETSKGMIALSYTIESETNKVGFGLSTELVNPNDDVFLRNIDGNKFFDASFGIYGIYDNQFKYGVSFPSLISSKINIEDGDPGDRDLGYIAHFAYATKTKESNIGVEPSIFIKSLNNIPTHVDLNVKLSFLDGKFVGAAGYTLGADKKIGFLMGTNVENLSINYSYNISTRSFQDYNNGAHEFSVAFAFNKKDKTPSAEDTKDIMNQ